MIKKIFLFVSILIGLNTFAQTVSGGWHHSLAVCNDNTVRAWGRNNYGQLGNGLTDSSNIPVQVNSLTGITDVSGGYYHSLALKNDGTVWAWGYNFNGQLGNTSNTNSTIPVQVSSLTGIVSINASYAHSFAIKNDGTVWAWGANSKGEQGNGTTTDSNVPVQMTGITGAVAVATGVYHTWVLKNDGTVWVCGQNSYGEFGNLIANSSVPVKVDTLSGIVGIEAGTYHSYALKNDGTVWACGKNGYGELGDATSVDKFFPVQVSGLTGVSAISVGKGYQALALKSNGSVMAWGYGVDGALGNATYLNSNIPVSVSSLTGVDLIAGGGRHSLALKNDGTLWSFGYNYYGGLGNGTNTKSNIPVLVTGMCSPLTSVTQIDGQSAVSIFPNPSTGKFQISISQSSTETIQLKVTDILGKEVYSEKITNGANNLNLDLSNLQNGIYFINGNNIHSQKIIIQK